jgi:hypothetical protein
MHSSLIGDRAAIGPLAMTRKPNQKSEEPDQTNRDTQREVEAKETSHALEKTLKKAGRKNLTREPEGRDN